VERRAGRGRLPRLFALALISVWSLGPICFIVAASLSRARDIFVWPPALLSSPTLANYHAIWTAYPEFAGNLANSFVVAAGATVLAIAVCTASGFAYSRFRSPALAASAFLAILLRMLPPIVLSLPLFPVVNALGLQDTRTVLVILYATFFVSLGTWIMKTSIDTIPRELDEAARVDGAGTLAIIRRVVMPLSAPGMIALGVFVAVYAWNEFLFAFLFTTTNAKTAPLAISEMLGSAEASDYGVLFAAATVQLAPVLLGVLLAQRYLIAGLSAGGVKG
jgi:multiple sugar transport system permease protein